SYGATGRRTGPWSISATSPRRVSSPCTRRDPHAGVSLATPPRQVTDLPASPPAAWPSLVSPPAVIRRRCPASKDPPYLADCAAATLAAAGSGLPASRGRLSPAVLMRFPGSRCGLGRRRLSGQLLAERSPEGSRAAWLSQRLSAVSRSAPAAATFRSSRLLILLSVERGNSLTM